MAPKKNPKKASPAQKEAADSKKKKNDVAGVGEGDKSDQVSPAEMRKQLDVLQMEKSKEGQERNYAQLERDKIASFLEIKKKEVEQAKAELRLKDRYFEEMEERHQDEIKVHKQKMKHLLYEQQNKIATVKIENELSLKLQREEAAKREMELRNDQWALKERIRELELGYEETIKQVKLDHAKEQTKMNKDYDVSAKDMQIRTEKKITAEKDGLYKRFENGIFEVQQRSDLKSLLLQRKVQVLGENLERKNAQLVDCWSATNK
eukprot:c21848_g1_i3 orf=3-788(-)